MITFITTFWHGEDVSKRSRCFTKEWVEKLYRGVERNLKDFDFVCLVDEYHVFDAPITQIKFERKHKAYMWILEIFYLDFGRCLFTGLDTIITGSLEDIASYQGDFAMIRDPNIMTQGASGVMAFPFRPDIYEAYLKDPYHTMDQNFLNTIPHDYLDDLYPNQMISYKCHYKKTGLGDARILYFHGAEKPHEIDEPFLKYWI